MEPSVSILLLPPLQSASPGAFNAAYGDTISRVLKEVSSQSSQTSQAAVLEIALALPELAGKQHAPRSSLYDTVHARIAAIYKLICVLAAKDSINVEDSQGVDVRILLLAWSPDGTTTGPAYGSAVVDIQTLAQSGRQWVHVYGVKSDAGEALTKAFEVAKDPGEQGDHMYGADGQPSRQPDEKVQRPSATSPQPKGDVSESRNLHVAVGGTFDHLHIGHKLLLTMTLFAVDSSPDKKDTERSATIGITGDQLLVNKKHAEVLESWSDRQHAVQRFLDSILNFTRSPPRTTTRDTPGPNGKSVDLHYPGDFIVKCTEIQDLFGPTITEEQISTLIISGETRSGGKAVNDKRKEKGWAELEVFEVDVLDAEDEGAEVKEGFGSKLSSTAIREKLARQTGAVGSKM
ncbi:hypothetical protein LTR53_008429 [Teratosphaeriaceae sp. CCFEE 6253]|nr:hypothetical protein LTR53_008429 [Teratosphaeriaceae sp. CCFEE 6253]